MTEYYFEELPFWEKDKPGKIAKQQEQIDGACHVVRHRELLYQIRCLRSEIHCAGNSKYKAKLKKKLEECEALEPIYKEKARLKDFEGPVTDESLSWARVDVGGSNDGKGNRWTSCGSRFKTEE